MPGRSDPRSFFRMRIRDLDARRTIYESIDVKPETVVSKVALTWVRRRQDGNNWQVEIWSRHNHRWRALRENEAKLVEILVQRYTENPPVEEAQPEEPTDPFKEVKLMPKAAAPTVSEEELLARFRTSFARLQEAQVALAADPDNQDLKQKVQFEQRDVSAYAEMLGYTPSPEDPTETTTPTEQKEES